MKIALVGSSGYIGSALAEYLNTKEHEVLCFGRSGDVDAYLDLRQAENFDYEKLEKVDFVVFTAAISGPDKCAVEFEECWKVNVTGTGEFIKEALNHGCRVLFFSSDAVYASSPGKIYDENDVMEPQTPYGRMKQAVEERFGEKCGFKALRLSYVVSAQDKFISYLRGCRAKKNIAEIFHPFYRNVVMLDEVLTSVVWLLEHWQQYEPSVLCLAGDELVSRLRIADELNELDNIQTGYRIVRPNGEFFSNRPMVTRMRSRYLYECGILSQKAFSERFRQQIRRDEHE